MAEGAHILMGTPN